MWEFSKQREDIYKLHLNQTEIHLVSTMEDVQRIISTTDKIQKFDLISITQANKPYSMLYDRKPVYSM